MQMALLDATNDAYADWLAESFAVEHLYARWSDATRGERALAFAAYRAALEREERAAEVHADMVRMAASRLAEPDCPRSSRSALLKAR